MSRRLLRSIDEPADLRRLAPGQLRELATEVRSFLIASVARTGGHLAANLGAVELSIALHYVFDTPHDRIVWDVGHQAYTHKILTGRRRAMSNLRQFGGISGFPQRTESPYDTFGTAHASTALSAALGMAVGARKAGKRRQVIAVIGDGALSAGMAFEAMNNAAQAGVDLLVVLNDNDMSISPAVGALNRHLGHLRSPKNPPHAAKPGLGRSFGRQVGRSLGRSLTRLPPVRRFIEGRRLAQAAAPNLFKNLGFNYSGPVDGHDLDALLAALRAAAELSGPQLLHVRTVKGRGYARAENDPTQYHGVGKFDPAEGVVAMPGKRPTFTQVFGDWLCDMAACDERIVAITPAMREGSGLVDFSQRHPGRFFDVGIAEQHAVTFAAGLACEGRKPVVAIYSTFLQRAYDQLIHDVQLQNLPVLFAIDRGGLAGADGPTHHGAFDLSFLRCVPNITVMVPSDENECRRMLYTGVMLDTPAAVRFPRGAGIGAVVEKPMHMMRVGKAQVRREGRGVAILAFGPLLHEALAAGERLDATVVDMRFVKPLDETLILQMARSHELIVTIEDNAVRGGAGSAVAEVIAEADLAVRMLHLGLPDRFIEQGDQSQLYAALGLTREGIVAAINKRDRPLALLSVPISYLPETLALH
jgi:1-deoxy-D-xylulose-5-phosphate synthase